MKATVELNYEPKLISVEDLEISKYNTRYNRIDSGLVARIKQSITDNGYDESFPILIGYVDGKDKLEILAGAHRWTACKELGLTTIPANVYKDLTIDNAVSLSYQNNQNQQTFKAETFIDLAYQVHRLCNENGKSKDSVSKMLNTNRTTITYYDQFISDLDPEIIKMVENSSVTQNSKKVTDIEILQVTENVTQVTVDWQFTWFRFITPLSYKYQHQIIQKILDNKDKTSTDLISKWSKLFKGRQVLETYFLANVPKEYLDEYIRLLETGTYDNYISKQDDKYIISDALIKDIEKLKFESQSIFENKDFHDFIPTLQEQSIDCLLTDPPYGKDYKSNRKQDTTDDVNQKIEGDQGIEEALVALNQCLELVNPKMKDESHCYIFCDWKYYPEFKVIIDQYFTIKNLIIWEKNNHGSGDLEGSYAPIYECIIFGVKGKRKLLGNRIPDIIKFAKVSDDKRLHPTEKPVGLLKILLGHSCQSGQMVLDPFAGVASTLVAAKELGFGYAGCDIESQYVASGKLRLNN